MLKKCAKARFPISWGRSSFYTSGTYENDYGIESFPGFSDLVKVASVGVTTFEPIDSGELFKVFFFHSFQELELFKEFFLSSKVIRSWLLEGEHLRISKQTVSI